MTAVLILILATALAFYILLGYPLLLALLRHPAAPVVRKDKNYLATVTVLMAVYNGAAFLRKKLEYLLALDYPRELVDIIVISDGSTDETDQIAEEFASSRVQLLRVPKGGKARALNAALPLAKGQILFFTDVRQPVDPSCLKHLVANFADPTIGAVSGEMRLLKGEGGEQADMDLYWRYEIWARKKHTEIDSLFSATGCVYAMRRELAAPLPPDTLSDDVVLPQRVFFQGYRIILDPEAVVYDYPTKTGAEFQRRTRTLAGVWQVFLRSPALFTRSRMRWHFLSHRFGRLVLPWTLIAIYLSTAALPNAYWRNSLLLNELFLPALALLDRFVPKGARLKRLTSPARTFLLMNFAALSAMRVFFVSAEKLWSAPTAVSREAAKPENRG